MREKFIIALVIFVTGASSFAADNDKDFYAGSLTYDLQGREKFVKARLVQKSRDGSTVISDGYLGVTYGKSRAIGYFPSMAIGTSIGSSIGGPLGGAAGFFASGALRAGFERIFYRHVTFNTDRKELRKTLYDRDESQQELLFFENRKLPVRLEHFIRGKLEAPLEHGERPKDPVRIILDLRDPKNELVLIEYPLNESSPVEPPRVNLMDFEYRYGTVCSAFLRILGLY